MKNQDGKDNMNNTPDKQLEAIGKIISLTRNDFLKWQHINPNEVLRKSDEDIIKSSYIVEYKDQTIRIYHRRYKASAIFNPFKVLFTNEKSTANDMRWYSEIVLDITNQNGESLWEFPREEILNDLLKIIKFKTSGADELINNLLNE